MARKTFEAIHGFQRKSWGGNSMSDINAIKITEPITITDSILIDSGSPPETNVPENDYPAWNVGTTYAEGDRVTPYVYTSYIRVVARFKHRQ